MIFPPSKNLLPIYECEDPSKYLFELCKVGLSKRLNGVIPDKYKDRLILGIGLELIKEYKTDPKVKVKFKKSESGPSAGLIATLEIYNQLTKKDLTKGYKIAGTGTIEEDGTIGEIGGITHKLLGASKSKTDIFLVPADNYQEALKYKKKHHLKIKLIKVKNIESAINKLEELK